MDHDQITATIDASNAAVAASDMDAILATFETNGALVGQPGATSHGTSALRAAFREFIAMDPKISVKDQDVVVADDIAIHTSTWNMTGQAPDGTSFDQNGFSVVILRRQPDGAWLIVIDNPFADHLLHKS